MSLFQRFLVSCSEKKIPQPMYLPRFSSRSCIVSFVNISLDKPTGLWFGFGVAFLFVFGVECER